MIAGVHSGIAPVLAMLLAAILLVLAAIHAYWAVGGIWPARSEKALARAVVGAPGISRMPPPGASFGVALALVMAALWPIMTLGMVSIPVPLTVFRLAGWLLAAIFLVRGVATYLPAFRRIFPEQPFARFDRLAYGPLCLVLGIAFLVLDRVE